MNGKLTIPSMLSSFYEDMILALRLSQNTAETYNFSVKDFLYWCVEEKIKLSAITTKDLMYYFAKKKTHLLL